jgi:hypothetical protein
MIVSTKMSHMGHKFFLGLAWAQLIAWLCDIIENIYLLYKLKPAVNPSKPMVHRMYQILEILKWGISLTGAVCSVFGLLYFWLLGDYLYFSLHYLLILIAEVLLFIIAGKIFHESAKEKAEKY